MRKTWKTTNRKRQVQPQPKLRFSPTAWAKLLYLRDRGGSEVGGFATSAADDLLYIDDVQLVRQACTSVSVVFDDNAVANYFDRQIERGLRPAHFGRIWWHTHPGQSAQPSSLDESTFARVFGRTDWAVMFILARGGETYARLRFNAGPGGSLLIPVKVEFHRPFGGSDFAAWDCEYRESVILQLPALDVPEMVGDLWSSRELTTTRPESQGFSDTRPEAEGNLFWEERTHEY